MQLERLFYLLPLSTAQKQGEKLKKEKNLVGGNTDQCKIQYCKARPTVNVVCSIEFI